MNRSLKTLLIAFTSLLFAVTASFAASSNWQDLGGGKGRLVATLDPGTQRLKGVLEVKLNPGWSTYWRYPGSTGIPPIMDFSRSTGMDIGPVSFITPQLLETGGIRYAGYKKSVFFPFEGRLVNQADASLRLELLIGICEEICIPAKASMEINGAELLRSDPAASAVLTRAALGVPKQKSAGDLKIETGMEDASTLRITLDINSKDPEPKLFVEGPAKWYLTPANHTKQDGNRHTFMLDVSNAPKGTDVLKTRLRYTLALGSSGIEFEY